MTINRDALDEVLPPNRTVHSKPAPQHHAIQEAGHKSLRLNHAELTGEEIEKVLRKDSGLIAALGVFVSIVEIIVYVADSDVRATFHGSPLFTMFVLGAAPVALFVAAATARGKAARMGGREAVREERPRLLEATEADRSGDER